MKTLKKTVLAGLCAAALLAAGSATAAPTLTSRPGITMEEVKAPNFATFDVSADVRMYRVSFSNQYGMKVAGNLFVPKNLKGKAAAIVIGHPMGASKEQAASTYGSRLATRGFVTLAMDQIFWGASGGEPRHAIAPDLYAETYMAAVDFLGTRDFVDAERIGALGICGSGSFVISAAKIDPRMKAIATVSMYNIGEMRRSGIKNSVSLERRKKVISDAANQRYNNFLGKDQVFTGGSPFKIDEKSNQVRQASYGYYRERGKYVPEGEAWEINTRSDMASNATFMNFYPFNDIETISPRPMLFVMGETAHSRYFTEEAYARAAEPKELVIIPKAGHFDLYDKPEFTPITRLERFYRTNLK